MQVAVWVPYSVRTWRRAHASSDGKQYTFVRGSDLEEQGTELV